MAATKPGKSMKGYRVRAAFGGKRRKKFMDYRDSTLDAMRYGFISPPNMVRMPPFHRHTVRLSCIVSDCGVMGAEASWSLQGNLTRLPNPGRSHASLR